MRLDENGNVGIGTTSPQAILHTASGAGDDFEGLRIINTHTDANAIDTAFIRLGITNAGGEKTCQIAAVQESNAGNAVGLRFGTNSSGSNNGETEKMRIDGSGKVGIGTTSPTNSLHLNSDDATFLITNSAGVNQSDAGYIRIQEVTSNLQGAFIHYNGDANKFHFGCHNTQDTDLANDRNDITIERTSGHILFGQTSPDTAATGARISSVSTSQAASYFYRGDSGVVMIFGGGGGSGQALLDFRHGGTTIGSVTKNGLSNVAFNTSSDYRLKENIVDLTGAITRLKTLQPKRFNWISDDTNTLQDGFLAHEVTTVPEAITGTKDQVVTQAMLDSKQVEDKSVGDPIYQQMDYSKLVTLLTAALQEEITLREALETRIAALEAA